MKVLPSSCKDPRNTRRAPTPQGNNPKHSALLSLLAKQICIGKIIHRYNREEFEHLHFRVNGGSLVNPLPNSSSRHK
ncbi:Uncharacterized protein DAT39_012700, partial [Clarias magur]